MLVLSVLFLLRKTYWRLSTSHSHNRPIFLWLIGCFSVSYRRPCLNSPTSYMQVASLSLLAVVRKLIEDLSMVALLLQVIDF